MQITKLCVKNYRLLTDIEFNFNEESNYFVGKNNIGKTSAIDLMATLLQGHNFKPDDFANIEIPITVIMTISIIDEETGIFGDNFSKNNSHEVILKFEQQSPDDRISISHYETNTEISISQIKKSNFIIYTSNIRPIGENDLTEKYGNYKLIPQLVNNYVNSHQKNNVEKNSYDAQLIEFVNNGVHKIRAFNSNNISVDFQVNYADFITQALSLTDGRGTNFSRLGYGIQFSSLIPLKIIDSIISWKRYNSLSKHLLQLENGKKELSIILCLDEPEVHLHPNLQLKVMKYIRNLLNGQDDEFNSLLKELFDIDVIKGQLFVVTHSPNILSHNYHQILRFSSKENQTNVSSGAVLSFDTKINKQLERQFDSFANALFADSVIITEGDSELAAIPIFADKLNCPLVDYNVNTIKADGFKNIPSLHKLFDSLKIKNVMLLDNDGTNRNWPYSHLFVTEQKDFEAECFEVMTLRDINHYLAAFEEVINDNQYDGSFWYTFFVHKKEQILAAKDKIGIIDSIILSLSDTEQQTIKDQIIQENNFMKRYLKKKSIINGQLIASNISNVPNIYLSAIKDAVYGE